MENLINVSTKFPQHMLLNSDKGPDNGIVQVPCRHSTLVCVVVLLPPD